MAACKVKPFQLVDRESLKDESKDSVARKVILKDGLKEVENLWVSPAHTDSVEV